MSSIFQRVISSKTVAVVSLLAFLMMFVPKTQAASLNTLSDVMTRQKDSSGGSVLSNHTIKFTLGGSTALNSGETIVVNFDDGFDLTGFANTEVEDFDI